MVYLYLKIYYTVEDMSKLKDVSDSIKNLLKIYMK